ncbi:hypothetical protein J2S89_001947 [Arthrobacter bambusae]|nr:hypothetical protein [Arthrobacter bambusae]MDQ0097805.1 hypothetical protein [Arthrobacter bambusae]
MFSLPGLVALCNGSLCNGSLVQAWAVSAVRAPGGRLAVRAGDAVRRASGVPVAMFGNGVAILPPFLVPKDHHSGYQCGSDKDHHDPNPLLPVHVRPDLSPSAGCCVLLQEALVPPAWAGGGGPVRSVSHSPAGLRWRCADPGSWNVGPPFSTAPCLLLGRGPVRPGPVAAFRPSVLGMNTDRHDRTAGACILEYPIPVFRDTYATPAPSPVHGC